MNDNAATTNGTVDRYLVTVRSAAAGQVTVQVVGLPEISATADSREAALTQVQALLQTWLNKGQLAVVEVPHASAWWLGFGHADPQDPVEQEYLAELARARQEDLERTLREYGPECSNSSSTPTT